MRLFQCSDPTQSDRGNAVDTACIVTPGGNIRTAWTVGRTVVSSGVHSETLALKSGARLARWAAKDAHLELLVTPFKPQLRPEMHVDGCVAALWRVQAISSVVQISVECTWNPPRPPAEFGGLETGECLESAGWNIGPLVVQIGTEDNDSLLGRAERGEFFPPRVAERLAPFDRSVVSCSYRGLTVRIPDLAAGELMQIQFIVAWATPAEPTDSSTWWAVDTPYQMILQQARCQ
jgi:hypothetical protein